MAPKAKNRQICVVGGGAAGFFGAITAAQAFPDAQVTLLEKNRTVLNKVRVSGGGRCNVTHACFDNRRLVENYPRGAAFLQNLLPQFDAADTVRWFERRGVRLKTEADGRMFPVSNRSETIVNCLIQAAQRAGVQVCTSAGVQALAHDEAGRWHLKLIGGDMRTADRVLVAVGGFPQEQSYGWLPAQAQPLLPPVASLFTFQVPGSPFNELAGISVEKVSVSVVGTAHRQQGALLLTHWGFSGPAILRLSAWAAVELANCQYRFELSVNFLPDATEPQLRQAFQTYRQQHGKQQVASHALFGFSLRLWQALVFQSGIDSSQRWAELPAKALNRLLETLQNSRFAVAGKSTFKDEFVICGGIDTYSLHPDTLESQTHPGLYFAGEVLNVDGITGGFNFQHAWTTGFVAGQHIGL